MTLARRVPAVSIVIVILLGSALPARAQARATTADLSGMVVDESRAVLPGTVITATNPATGLERRAVAGANGRYVVPALPAGVYTVAATLAGFAPTRAENVTLVIGEVFFLPLMLHVAGPFEEINVVAEPAPGAISNASIATVVTSRQIEALPTNGRNFIAFAAITAGANIDRTPQQGASTSSGLTFVGQRGRSNNITVDGLDNNDFVAGGVRALFSQEAVQEFQVLAGSYSAEFGKAAGGVVNIVTKSGTNRTSGNLFGYFRHDALNAREHFERFELNGVGIDRRKAPYRQQQFGGTLGGPLQRNRSFYFLSAERLRVRANNFVTIPPGVAGILQEAGFGVELGHVPFHYESDQVLARVDRAGSRHQLSLRFNWSGLLDENIEPWGGLVARSRGASLDGTDLMGGGSLTSFFSSRTVNELRLQVANRDQKVISLDPRCHGTSEWIDECGPAVNIGQQIQVGRHAFTPQPRENRRYQVVETLSHAVGPHQLKLGGDVSWVHQPHLAWPYTFGGRYQFQTPADLALGRPDFYVQGYGNPSADDKLFSYVSLFAQDTWHARHLTLQCGVRYQNQFFPRIVETVPGFATYGWPADNNNLAPRLGASWNPFPDGKTSVTGSYGVFYDHLPGVIWGGPYVLSGTPDHTRVLFVSSRTAREAWNSPGRRLPEPAAYPSTRTTFDPALKTPFAHHVSVGVSRTFGAGIAMSVEGVYVRGVDQVGQLDYNPIVNGARPLDSGGVRSASEWQFTSWADSWYRGLIVSVEKRLGARSQFLAVYALSKAEDLATDYSFSQPQEVGYGRNEADPTGLPLGFDPDSERGPSLQDQRHRFVLSGLYLFPGRITVSGIITIGSGRPYNITAGMDKNQDGFNDNDRPWRIPKDLASRIGRNAGLLPGTSTVDLRLSKRLPVRGRTLELILEAFNLFNHTNYTAASAVFGEGAYPADPGEGLGEELRDAFGRFTKAGPPFQAQLAAKISF